MRLGLLLLGLAIAIPSSAKAPLPDDKFQSVPELGYRIDPGSSVVPRL